MTIFHRAAILALVCACGTLVQAQTGTGELRGVAWMGHSIGRWEKDTLVIDTTGFNDKVWLEGNRPQTERLHIVERYRRIDVGRMSVEITIDDPDAYTRPWKVRRLLQLAPGEEIQEYLCNENHKTEHFVGN